MPIFLVIAIIQDSSYMYSHMLHSLLLVIFGLLPTMTWSLSASGDSLQCISWCMPILLFIVQKKSYCMYEEYVD